MNNAFTTLLSGDVSSDQYLAAFSKLPSIKSFITQEKYLIVGFTATSGNADAAIALSKQRAECIKLLLSRYGLDPELFTVTGLGYESDNIFHVTDLDKNGNLDESLAKKNRRILILPDTVDNEKKVKLAG